LVLLFKVIPLTRQAAAIVVEVADDGRGGVVEAGGLSGLRRRIAVFDGRLDITSPAGGPTVARIVLPAP